MTKLSTLTLIAAATISLSGCSSGFLRWPNRGDACGTCTTAYGEGMQASPSFMAPSYVSPQELHQPLPGPIVPST